MNIIYTPADLEASDYAVMHGVLEVYGEMKTFLSKRFLAAGQCQYLEYDWRAAEHGCLMDAPELLPDAGYASVENNRGRCVLVGYVQR